MNAARLVRQDRPATRRRGSADGSPAPRRATVERARARVLASLPTAGRPGRLVAAMRDTGRRNIYLSAAAIPLHLVMAGWKTVLMIVSPSFFMLANVVFTFGLAGVKLVVVLADKRWRTAGDDDVPLCAYRLSGLVLLVLALCYAALCVPLTLGHTSTERYSYELAIAIATVTFVELGFSIHGFVASRRRRDLLMETVKLSNVAAALLFLVLTQTALLSMTSEADHSRFNGLCGIIMGAGAALIGLRMLVRRRPVHAAIAEPRRTPHQD